MWEDRECPVPHHRSYSPDLPFDDDLWRELIDRFAVAGGNQIVLDLGDGVQYRSHPEIAVRNAWPVERLKKEIAEIESRGIQVIPKLNFSTAHDTWLGPYARCVSTPRYYEVCLNLIREVAEIFDGPEFFHIGMDEEAAEHQEHYGMVVVRQHELWWHDLNFLVDAVEETDSRAWVWSDQYWRHPDDYLANMPKRVLQSNWHYEKSFPLSEMPVRAYLDLEAAGFDQVPTGSNHSEPENFQRTVAFCRDRISSERLLGFLQTPWRPTQPPFREHHLQAIENVADAIAGWKDTG